MKFTRERLPDQPHARPAQQRQAGEGDEGMPSRIVEWSGLTGLQCLHCKEFHIDRAHSDGNYLNKAYQQARAEFTAKHSTCIKPTQT